MSPGDPGYHRRFHTVLNPDHARGFGELEALWCPATDEMDLSITEREGPGFEHI